MSECIIKIDNLTVALNKTDIINNMNLQIQQKDFLIIFGEDDAGKTTLLNALMGFNKIKLGSVQFWEHNIKELSKNKKCAIRFVPDNIIMEQEMTVAEYFQFMSMGAVDYDIELEEKLCEKFDINKQEVLLDMTYQGNKLVAIIAAMCVHPQLLILDEPYNFLEKSTMKEILKELDLLNEQGTCIILTVEKYEHALGYGNRYLYMEEGNVKGEGEITEADIRMKAVSVPRKHDKEVAKKLGEILGKQKYMVTYRYTGTMKQLLEILRELQCDNFSIEDITLKEELDEDYSRWE